MVEWISKGKCSLKEGGAFHDGFSAQGFLHSPGDTMLPWKCIRVVVATLREVRKVPSVLSLIFVLCWHYLCRKVYLNLVGLVGHWVVWSCRLTDPHILMTTVCPGQSFGGELVKMLLVCPPFYLTGIRRGFVCTLRDSKNYEGTGFLLSLFQECSSPALTLEHVTILMSLYPEHPQRRECWVRRRCGLCGCLLPLFFISDLAFPHPCSSFSASLPIDSFLHGLWEQAELHLELIPVTSYLTLGKIYSLFKPQCPYL